MARFLVTGQAGFIGFHVTAKLLTLGHDVVGYDSLSSYYDPALKVARLARLETNARFTSVEADLEDRPRLDAVFAEYEPEVVVHLAAQAGVRYSIDSPETYISSNIVGTFNLLEAIRERPIDHLLMASSSSVYGGNSVFPFSELHRTDHPVSLYAATKKATEVIAHSYSQLWKIPTTAFRFFTVYGPWGRPDMALFKFVSAIEAGLPIDVYGNGVMRRDFTYIDDLVHAIVRLVDVVPIAGLPVGENDSLSPVAPYRVVNLGGGSPVGLLDFISAIEAATGRTAVRNLLPMQPGDVAETSSDPRLLADLIGTVPTTPVGDGVKYFVEWWREYSADRR